MYFLDGVVRKVPVSATKITLATFLTTCSKNKVNLLLKLNPDIMLSVSVKLLMSHDVASIAHPVWTNKIYKKVEVGHAVFWDMKMHILDKIILDKMLYKTALVCFLGKA